MKVGSGSWKPTRTQKKINKVKKLPSDSGECASTKILDYSSKISKR